MHETGLLDAWFDSRRHKRAENHRARCVIDPQCRDYRAITYRFHPANRIRFFSFIEHCRYDNHRNNKKFRS